MTQFAKVYLVGGGPGNPDLLTVKALRLLKIADVVLYDRLISPAVLELIPASVSRVPVGKAAGNHSIPQEQINELLVELSRRHAIVVRLKGGDPFTFGRGSEEALHLSRLGIAFEVVPGVTAPALVFIGRTVALAGELIWFSVDKERVHHALAGAANF